MSGTLTSTDTEQLWKTAVEAARKAKIYKWEAEQAKNRLDICVAEQKMLSDSPPVVANTGIDIGFVIIIGISALAGGLGAGILLGKL